MLKVVNLNKDQIELITNNYRRDQFQYHEYRFLTDRQLHKYFRGRMTNVLNNEDSKAIVAISGNNIFGLVVCIKDNFDSEVFGFPCYKIIDFLVFSEEYKLVCQIINKMINALEEELLSVARKFYLAISLNNNTKYIDYLFNGLISNNYYYIHTLLTFSNLKNYFEVSSYYPEQGISIRVATANDVEQVVSLAQKSYQYSRFHLDPFLDNCKANLLLGISARNSICHGFVDVTYVAEIKGKIVGYYSAKKRVVKEFERTVGESVISAVDENYRGLGIFTKLNDYILNWYSDNTDFSEVGTYLANYPVHKTFINCGLGLIRGSHQFSKMINLNRE